MGSRLHPRMKKSAIGSVGDCYYQNTRVLKDYYARLETGGLPVSRGIALTREGNAVHPSFQGAASEPAPAESAPAAAGDDGSDNEDDDAPSSGSQS